jgi:hypothetical protein
LSRRAFIIDAAKPSIGDIDPADHAQGCAPRAAKKQRTADGQPKVVARGLATDELLAKIDALDWEDTVLPAAPPIDATGTGAPMPSPALPPERSWLPVVGGATILLIAGLLLLYQILVAGDAPRGPVNANPVAAPVVPTREVSPDGGADDEARLAAVEAQERQRAAKFAQAVRQGEENALRKAERLRKAREVEQARLEREQQQQEQERRRRDEEARLRAERETAEARARVPAAAPVPRGPASPQELCAEESNFFSRGLCEGRACGRPEWQHHPFCVKRTEDQLRKLSPAG